MPSHPKAWNNEYLVSSMFTTLCLKLRVSYYIDDCSTVFMTVSLLCHEVWQKVICSCHFWLLLVFEILVAGQFLAAYIYSYKKNEPVDVHDRNWPYARGKKSHARMRKSAFRVNLFKTWIYHVYLTNLLKKYLDFKNHTCHNLGNIFNHLWLIHQITPNTKI